MVYLVCRLMRMSEQRGRAQTAEDSRSWWLVAVVSALVVGAVSFVGVMLAYPNLEAAQGLEHAIIRILTFTFLAIPFSVLAWLFGRWYRPGKNVEYYFSDEGMPVGPFTIEQLRKYKTVGTLKREDLVCRAGTEAWVNADRVLDFDERPLSQLSVSNISLHRLHKIFTPSMTMNYRIFIPSLIGALLLGALLHWGFAERYRFQAMGGGWMMKTDRWTGKAWKIYGQGDSWRPVQEGR